MKRAINEVKIQAKKLFKSLKTTDTLQHKIPGYLKKLKVVSVEEIQLKHCLILVSQELGFINWHEAQEVLTGRKALAETSDFGTFFYPEQCGAFINEWFSDYQQAKSLLNKQPKNKWLLPYKKQFLVVGQDYINQFDLNDMLLALGRDIEHDMVKSYHSFIWDELSCAMIKNRRRIY